MGLNFDLPESLTGKYQTTNITTQRGVDIKTINYLFGEHKRWGEPIGPSENLGTLTHLHANNRNYKIRFDAPDGSQFIFKENCKQFDRAYKKLLYRANKNAAWETLFYSHGLKGFSVTDTDAIRRVVPDVASYELTKNIDWQKLQIDSEFKGFSTIFTDPDIKLNGTTKVQVQDVIRLIKKVLT